MFKADVWFTKGDIRTLSKNLYLEKIFTYSLFSVIGGRNMKSDYLNLETFYWGQPFNHAF